MTDTPKIAPALTPDEWAGLRARGVLLRHSTLDDILSLDEDDMRRAIAMANDALQDDDPRKITRAWIATLRSTATRQRHMAGWIFAASGLGPDDETEEQAMSRQSSAALEAIADALESYLPPPA